MARSCTNWYLLQSRSFESNLRCHCIVRGRFNTLKLHFVQNLSNKWTNFEGYHQRLWAEPKRNKRVGWNGSLLGSKYFGNQAISSIDDVGNWYTPGCPGNLVYIHVSHKKSEIKLRSSLLHCSCNLQDHSCRPNAWVEFEGNRLVLRSKCDQEKVDMSKV